jgi:hypothetical protein
MGSPAKAPKAKGGAAKPKKEKKEKDPNAPKVRKRSNTACLRQDHAQFRSTNWISWFSVSRYLARLRIRIYIFFNDLWGAHAGCVQVPRLLPLQIKIVVG